MKKSKKNKPIKVVVVECKEGYEWDVYSVQRNTTPIKAIRAYLKEMGLDHKQKIIKSYNNSHCYCPVIDDDVVRAQTYTI
mgnify:CR=1 FL=1